MKTKLKFSKLFKKIPKVPLKYLYIGGAAIILLLATGTTLLLSNYANKQPANTTTGAKDASSSQPQKANNKDDTPEATKDQPATSPAAEQPPSATPTLPGNTAKPPGSNKSSAPGSAPAALPQKDTQKPSTPTGFVVYNDPNHDYYRILDWNASVDNVGIAGYRIYKRTNTYETYKLLHTVADGSSDDTDTYPMCSIMDVYGYYAVEAYDAAGNVSDWAEAKIRDDPWANCYPVGV